MSEELKRKFEAFIKADDQDADYISINACIDFMQQAYDLAKEDDWVSVSERFPNCGDNIIVCEFERPENITRFKEGDVRYFHISYTHWMIDNLPSPPTK